MKRYAVTMLCVLCLVFPAALCNPVTSQTVDSVDIVVACPAQEEWTGAYGAGGSSQSVQGTGPTSYTLNRGSETYWVISAAFSKHSAGSWNLTVSIVTGSTVHKTSSTTAEYGAVSVVWIYTTTTPGIPGFPFAAVMVGLIGALTTGFAIRRRNR